MAEVNCHIIRYTARDVSPTQYRFGATWQSQDAPCQAIRGTLAHAREVLAARIERDTRPVDPGTFAIIEFTDHELHSWHESETPINQQFNVDPLGRILSASGGRW